LCTQLGQATFFSSLSPSEALIVLHSLEQARKKLILTSDLHAVYLVTPSAGLILTREQWQQLATQLATTTCEEVKEVMQAVEIPLDYVYRISRGSDPDPSNSESAAKHQALCQRFIAALALFNLMEATPVPQVVSTQVPFIENQRLSIMNRCSSSGSSSGSGGGGKRKGMADTVVG